MVRRDLGSKNLKQIFSVIVSLVLVLGFGHGVGAQETEPTPQTVGGSIVSELETEILRGFFVALDAATQSDNANVTIEDIVSDVLETVVTSSGEADDDSDDDESDDNDDSDDDDSDDDDGNGKSKNKKGKGKDKGKGKNKKIDKSNPGRGDGLPPGLQKQLAKNGTLPPGLQRKLEESGVLPAGLQASALPPELEAQLPSLPENQKRIIIDNDVLIIEEVTGQVLDSIPDIIPPDVAEILKRLPDIMMSQ